jgi:type II secretory pathway pseudopilin PulG
MTQVTAQAIVAKKTARQAGLTLAETLLVLAIGALAIVGGTLLYLQATAGNKLNTGINQFVTLQSGIRSLYAGQSNYTGLDNTLITDSNAAPSDMVAGAGVLRNAWGGAVTVLSTGATEDQFSIQFVGVPTNACVKLITLNPGGTGGSGLVGIDIAGGGTPAAYNAGAGNIPVTTANAVATCAAADDSVDITWTFN